MLQRPSSLIVLCAAVAAAYPFQQQVLQQSQKGVTAKDESDFNVLHHLSGISPYFQSHGPDVLNPKGCKVANVAILARHGSITANDDEWPETLGPFVKKFTEYDASQIPETSTFSFLRDWTTPVTEDTMEQFTEPGAKDAKKFARELSERYKELLPGNKDPAFKVYSASSSRDTDSAKAFIEGMFPERVLGKKPGQVDLVSVPNKAEKWSSSLTPHKSCDRFDKSVGKPERDAFQKAYTAGMLARYNEHLPGWDWTWTDLIAMQQMCGYETAIRGSSQFCNVFDQNEMEHFEYSQDLHYFYMLGRQNKWSAALGIPWLQIAVNKLAETVEEPVHQKRDYEYMVNNGPTPIEEQKKAKLPKPTSSPNDTLSQPLHIWFTHREEVPLVTGALDLFHQHEPIEEMPLDHINYERVWKTSEIIPFLGHVAIERLQCDEGVVPEAALLKHRKKHKKHHHKHHKGDKDKKPGHPDPEPATVPFVRIIVNGSPQVHPACNDGPDNMCGLEDFIDLVQKLPSTYGDLEKICQVDDK